VLTSDGVLPADLVILAIGVVPDSRLAQMAGLRTTERAAIIVDDHQLTSDPDIYAVGDSVEVTDTVTGLPTVVPLAGPANRQGRIAADHMFGRDARYTTTQGTAIVKVFDITAGGTGANEKSLRRAGIDYRKVYVHPNGHASYYPGTAAMHLKLLFSPDGQVLGGQVVGYDGVDKRIDVLAVAIRAGLTVWDLSELELAYAPPYGSAKDPINMAGFQAANLLDGTIDVLVPGGLGHAARRCRRPGCADAGGEPGVRTAVLTEHPRTATAGSPRRAGSGPPCLRLLPIRVPFVPRLPHPQGLRLPERGHAQRRHHDHGTCRALAARRVRVADPGGDVRRGRPRLCVLRVLDEVPFATSS
jgi:hypothetical protein